ncbi:hypothetical protein GCM10007989_24370 [Devosia pacifica]|uniref:Uncharacterized protein n=1 Tax=Devosia pacifica TaxID=1335967 RepID=A0A918S7F0_9HYPH|nr:hypothetical protein [Devosia pacifica]GHA27628.1 hypothetical protein GCM10007989_24370 [Devosia pacifica]
MRIAIDQDSNGVIDNVIEAEGVEAAQAIFPGASVFASDEIGPGWASDGEGGWQAPATQPEFEPQAPVRIDTPLFLMRFTPQERIGIRQAAKTDLVIEDWFAIINDPRLAYIELGDPNLTAGMGYLVQQELLTEARAQEVLAP